MSRGQSIGLCLLLLVLLLLYCINHHAPLIEQDLSDRSRLVLAADNMTWADVVVAGRKLTLTGKAPNVEQRQRAGESVAAVWGVHSVDNQLEISSAIKAGAPAP